MKYQNTYHYESVEELNSAPHGWDADILPLHDDSHNVRLCTSASSRLMINTVEMDCATLQRGSTPEGMQTFSLILEQDGAHTFRGREFNLDTLVIFPRDRELQAASTAGISLLNISIAQEAVATAIDELGLPPDILSDTPEAIAFSRGERERLLAYLEHLSHLMVSAPASRASRAMLAEQEAELTSCLLHEIIALTRRGAVVSRDKRYRATRAALDYIQNHPREPISIGTLAREVGASRRTIETGFRDMLDISPGHFIKQMRLRGCHKELVAERDIGASISETAQDWGFWHLGQFAADYRKLFGELPTQTLRAG